MAVLYPLKLLLLVFFALSWEWCDAFFCPRRAGLNTLQINESRIRVEASRGSRDRRNSVRRPRGRIVSDNGGQLGEPKHAKPTSTSKDRVEFPFLKNLQSPAAIEEWMHSLHDSDISPFHSWTSREEALFIRKLGELRAFSAILLYVKKHARPNTFVYTAAIAALALEEEKKYKRECLSLLQEMEVHGVTPSPYTLTALFQSVASPEEALALATQVRQKYSNVRWTPPVWEAAIAACARSQENCPQQALSCACQFFQQQSEQAGQRPTQGTYQKLFGMCTAARDAAVAQSFLQSMLEVYPPRKVAPPVWGAYLQVCAATGFPVAARLAIQTMVDSGRRPNVRHWTAYLKALTTAGLLDEALQCLEEMSRDPARTPDTVAVQTVLGAYARVGDYHQARRLLKRLSDGGFQGASPDEQCYNQVLAACESPVEARALIREMRLSRRSRVGAVPPSKISYTRAIGVCRKARDLSSALLFLKNADRDDGVKPDVYMYSAVIWAAAESKESHVALELLKEMKEQQCHPNTVSFNGVIAALASCGRADDALSVYKEMKAKRLDRTRSTFFYLTTSSKTLELSKRMVFLMAVFDTMETHDRLVSVGGPLVEALILVCCEVGNFDLARRAFNSISGKSDAACLRAMLLGCAKSVPPQWQEALLILNDSCDDLAGAAPDSGALRNTIVACSKANKWEEALQLLRRFGRHGASTSTVNAVVAACGRSGRPDVALELLNNMEDYGAAPDARSYRNAIIACNQAEHAKRRSQARNTSIGDQTEQRLVFEWWECALSLLQRMPENGLRPDVQCYSSTISACEAAGKWQIALGILQTTMDEAADAHTEELNLYCFNAAISACEKGGAWVEALEIYERMKLHSGNSLRPNIVTLSSVILALDSAGQKELSLQIYNEGVKARVVSPWRGTRGPGGERIRALDLHKFSTAMARAAVRSHLESLLSGVQQAESWVIIVGKGLRSATEPVLLASVQQMLEADYGINGIVDKNNPGRLVVERAVLLELISRKGW